MICSMLNARCFRCFTGRVFPPLVASSYWIIDPLCNGYWIIDPLCSGDGFSLACLHWQVGGIFLFAGLHHAYGSLLLMFYRRGFSFIDGNVVLDHRSLVQVCRPLGW